MRRTTNDPLSQLHSNAYIIMIEYSTYTVSYKQDYPKNFVKFPDNSRVSDESHVDIISNYKD